jgi:hypothetical protein
VRARESERARKRERERENARARERARESERATPGPYQAPHSPAPKSIAAGRERCAAQRGRGSPHDFSSASCSAHCYPRIPAASRLLPSPTPPACSTPIGTSIERFLAAAAGQHGKTAAPPANARSSPRVAGRTQPSISVFTSLSCHGLEPTLSLLWKFSVSPRRRLSTASSRVQRCIITWQSQQGDEHRRSAWR